VDTELLFQLLLFPAGFLAGIVNVLAGGGSFLTLPVLIASGLPIHVANGTNRISVIVQGLFATADYHKKGQFDPKLYKTLLPPILLGSLGGAYLATRIDPERLGRVFGVLFVLMAIFLVVRERMKWALPQRPHPLRHLALFLVGAYGGFIQAGVGLWILLTSSTLFAVDALRANTVKLPLTLTFTTPALLLFLHADMVRWIPGLILAAGTVLGAIVGVRLSLKGGAPLIWRAVTAVLLVTGTHLLLR